MEQNGFLKQEFPTQGKSLLVAQSTHPTESNEHKVKILSNTSSCCGLNYLQIYLSLLGWKINSCISTAGYFLPQFLSEGKSLNTETFSLTHLSFSNWGRGSDGPLPYSKPQTWLRVNNFLLISRASRRFLRRLSGSSKTFWTWWL